MLSTTRNTQVLLKLPNMIPIYKSIDTTCDTDEAVQLPNRIFLSNSSIVTFCLQGAVHLQPPISGNLL